MTSRGRAAALGALVAGSLALVAPALALADNGSGGAGFGSTSTTSTTASATTPAGAPPAGSSASAPAATADPSGPVSASGNGYSLSVAATGTLRRTLTFSGSVAPADHGDTLAIQRQRPDGSWTPAALATVAADGSFTAPWRATQRGVIAFRAALEAPAGTASAADATPSSPSVSVTIYTPGLATIYGPGFYGHRTACGERLSRSTLGVASRTLPCGTEVSISWHGRSISVPVIDRGPYANGASWDLTSATAAALGDPGTATIGAAVL